MASGALVLAPDEVADLLVLELLRGALVGLLVLAEDVFLYPVSRCMAIPFTEWVMGRTLRTEAETYTCRACLPLPLRPPSPLAYVSGRASQSG